MPRRSLKGVHGKGGPRNWIPQDTTSWPQRYDPKGFPLSGDDLGTLWPALKYLPSVMR